MDKGHIVSNFEQLAVFQKYAVVLDIEHTCTEDGSIPPKDREIIEIGAVLVNTKSSDIVDEYKSIVRPTIHPVVSQFCRDLTGITQSELDESKIFKHVFLDFLCWLPAKDDWLLVTWGSYDLIQLNIDCSRHGLSPFSPVNFLNLKKAFKEVSGLKKLVGLKKAMEISKGSFSGTHHRALDDAKNAANILFHILNKPYECKTEHADNSKAQRLNPFKNGSLENPGADRTSSRARSKTKLKNLYE